MKSNDPSYKVDGSQSIDVSRRKFLTASAVGIAGLGAVGSAAAAPDEHTLVIDGSGPYTSYQFTVGGNLEKSTTDGASINSGDEIVGRSAHGAVKGGKDTYTFTGPLHSFNFDGPNAINVELDGEPARVGERPDYTIVIEGFGEYTEYSFSSLEGAYMQSEAYGASFNEGERVNPYGAEGAVIGGKDAFTYDGELLSFDFEGGEIRVTIDGKAAHVGQLPDRTLTIVGNGEYTEYEFSVDGGEIRGVIDAEESEDGFVGDKFTGVINRSESDRITYDNGVERTSTRGGSVDFYSNYRRLFA